MTFTSPTEGESISYVRNSPSASRLVFQPNNIQTSVNISDIRKKQFNPKNFKSRHFLSPISYHHFTLSLPILSLCTLSLSSRSLSLCTLSLSLPGLTAFPQPLRLAPPCASPALSLARPHLCFLHCCTTFSNPTPSEYHCPTLISGDPISNSGFTSWVFLLFFSLFLFVCLFLFLGIYLILFYFLVV